MKRLIPFLLVLPLAAPCFGAEPAKKTVNSIGMEFVLIPAGEFIYGRFNPNYPAGTPEASGMTQVQFDAVRAMNEKLAAVQAAAAAARAALAAASLNGSDRGQLASQAAALGEAEASLAAARASGFEELQKSPGRLGRPQVATLAQQTVQPAAAGGGRGGGGNPADLARSMERLRATRAQYPGFTVKIPRPFYLGTYEVTQEQWTKVMGSNPSTFQNGRFGVTEGDRHPVETVSWADAQEFIRKLNALENTNVYRLPTEFEWEYAGKAGAEDDPTGAEIRNIAVISAANVGRTSPVGTRPANPWGLHDMLGNVWEWVADFYNDKFFADPTPPTQGTEHVLKGTGFVGDIWNAYYSYHGAGPADKWEVGFRIVREAR